MPWARSRSLHRRIQSTMCAPPVTGCGSMPGAGHVSPANDGHDIRTPWIKELQIEHRDESKYLWLSHDTCPLLFISPGTVSPSWGTAYVYSWPTAVPCSYGAAGPSPLVQNEFGFTPMVRDAYPKSYIPVLPTIMGRRLLKIG